MFGAIMTIGLGVAVGICIASLTYIASEYVIDAYWDYRSRKAFEKYQKAAGNQ